eukprot:TRINITY_DN1663_c0_g1_i1.p1 TRINITY_DN1663_c0_g1~~TRINITY_DN1663_c0_g1_i1.p1  ORF type:complete len:601 (+),score=132.11 TRINITY_DN1663_c0_g1_i1:44-1846(+)
MSRSLPYRLSPSAVTASSYDLAEVSQFLVLQEIGPLSFVIGQQHENERKKKFKVSFGNTHTCSCHRPGDICVHQAWVLLRVFNITREEAISFQVSFTDREIEKLIRTRFYRYPSMRESENKEKSNSNILNTVLMMEITEETLCPICYMGFTKGDSIVYCSCGCGNSLHSECFKMYTQHANSANTSLSCPLCRQRWVASEISLTVQKFVGYGDQIDEINAMKKKILDKIPPFVHEGFKCSICSMDPISGPLYKSDEHSLCLSCYSKNHIYKELFFCFLSDTLGPFEVNRPSVQDIDPDSKNRLRLLQHRDITPNDYELLMMLAQTHTYQPASLSKFRRMQLCLPAFHVSDVSIDNEVCGHCDLPFLNTERVNQLPCGHFVHFFCEQSEIDKTRACPTCGMNLLPFKTKKKKSTELKLERLETVIAKKKKENDFTLDFQVTNFSKKNSDIDSPQLDVTNKSMQIQPQRISKPPKKKEKKTDVDFDIVGNSVQISNKNPIDRIEMVSTLANTKQNSQSNHVKKRSVNDSKSLKLSNGKSKVQKNINLEITGNSSRSSTNTQKLNDTDSLSVVRNKKSLSQNSRISQKLEISENFSLNGVKINK